MVQSIQTLRIACYSTGSLCKMVFRVVLYLSALLLFGYSTSFAQKTWNIAGGGAWNVPGIQAIKLTVQAGADIMLFAAAAGNRSLFQQNLKRIFLCHFSAPFFPQRVSI